MTVFALLIDHDHEGSTLLGVYSSRELALEAHDSFCKEMRGGTLGGELVFREIKLNGAASF